MAVVSATFEYVRVNRGLVRELWPTVREEVNMMRGFIPFLMLDMGRRKAPIVLAQDAAGPTRRPGSERQREPIAQADSTHCNPHSSGDNGSSDKQYLRYGAYCLAHRPTPPLASMRAVVAGAPVR